jgi:CheY-like chemotaxis protein
MEAVGQLVAGVAHNFNNLLTITMGYTEILLERHRGADEDQAELEQIRLATAKAASLTRHLLTFSRQRETAPAPIDLNRALADLRPILTRAVREDIQLTIQTAAAQATVLIDLQDFDQVILNLVINARDALPSGGAIEITLEPRSLSAAECPSDVVPGDYICIEVRDDGVGMTDEVQAHLFEPFFTTKEVGQGTGLGLASTYGTVRQHRGFVRVSSAPERGTAVSLWFPCAGPGAASETVPVSTPMRTRRKSPHATILVVEDEGGVRAVTAGTLSRAGHRVFEAASASEACAIFARHANEIDLLVTDVVMPVMSGTDLAARVTSSSPRTRVLFVSGFVPAGSPSLRGAPLVAKPLRRAELLDAVHTVLDGAA